MVLNVTTNEDAYSFRRKVRKFLRDVSITQPEFFVRSPIRIDCSEDITTFKTATTQIIREVILNRHAKGKLNCVSSLPPTARKYAQLKLKECHSLLDKKVSHDLREFLEQWATQSGRGENQKLREDPYLIGVEIVLPVTRIKLPYHITNVTFL